MGDRINQIRKSEGLTVEEFAKRLKYSISAVIKIIYNEREPSRRFLKRLKQEFPEAIFTQFLMESNNHSYLRL